MKKRPLKDWINIFLTLLLYFFINPLITALLFIHKHYVWFGLWLSFTLVCFALAFRGKRILLWFLQRKIDAVSRVK